MLPVVHWNLRRGRTQEANVSTSTYAASHDFPMQFTNEGINYFLMLKLIKCNMYHIS